MTALKAIGILGAGQLGRMTAVAAAQLGIRAHIFALDAKDSPAAEVAQTFTQGQIMMMQMRWLPLAGQ